MQGIDWRRNGYTFFQTSLVPVGIETITIAPANGSSIYNSSGTAMSSSASIQDAFTDKNGPYITAASTTVITHK